MLAFYCALINVSSIFVHSTHTLGKGIYYHREKDGQNGVEKSSWLTDRLCPLGVAQSTAPECVS